MLDIQYTEKGLKDLNYVVVSAKVRKGNDPEIKGLFLGIKPVEQEEAGLPTDLFLWIYNNNTVFILNLEHYIVSSIETCIHEYAKKSQTISFKDSEQCSAAAKLHIIQNALVEQKRIRSDGLIEVASYKSLPEYLAKMALKPNNSTQTTPTPPYKHNKRIYNHDTHQWENTKKGVTGFRGTSGYYADRKEVETSLFRRTTRYSAEKAIADMKTKIEEIRSGKHKPTKLKRIPADSVKEKKKEEKEKEATENQITNNMTEVEEAYREMWGN